MGPPLAAEPPAGLGDLVFIIRALANAWGEDFP